MTKFNTFKVEVTFTVTLIFKFILKIVETKFLLMIKGILLSFILNYFK